MAQGIKGNRSKHFLRHRHHAFRIDNGNFRDNGTAAQGLLVLIVRIGQDRKAVALGTGPACRRQKNQRQRPVALSASVDIVADVPFIFTEKSNAFGTVHDGAAADGNDHVAAVRFCKTGPLFRCHRQRVCGDLIIKDTVDSLCRKGCRDLVIES